MSLKFKLRNELNLNEVCHQEHYVEYRESLILKYTCTRGQSGFQFCGVASSSLFMMILPQAFSALAYTGAISLELILRF